MDSTPAFTDSALKPELDPSLYNLKPEELAFYRQQTGIEDEAVLKAHVLSVQAKAYQVLGYPCIRRFSFMTLKIFRLPGYHHALKLLNTRTNPLFLDMGCCFGTDVRKAIADGWPAEDTLASDLRPAFWKYGHELFRTRSESAPISFIPGDVFDPDFIPPPHTPYANEADIPNPQSIPSPPFTSFKPLAGRIDAIHTSSFFHLFSESQQLQVAKILSSLLSTKPGSIIFGRHIGRPRKGMTRRYLVGTTGTDETFCHSPESWIKLWEEVFGQLGGKDSVKVEATLVRDERRDVWKQVALDAERVEIDPTNQTEKEDETRFYVIHWSVIRLKGSNGRLL